MDYAHLVWSSTALGVDFGHYELQRRDAFDSTWRTIAEITTEAVSSFDDYEARRGIQSDWRMRVHRADGAISDWTNVVDAIPYHDECELLFVSNEDPTLNLAIAEITQPRRYEFPREEAVYPLQGRDGWAAFSGSEDRFVRFTSELMLAGSSDEGFLPDISTAQPGMTVWEDLQAIERASLSYVCVLNKDADRWFARIRVAEGLRIEPAQRHSALVDVIELTRVPSVPDKGAV